MGKIISFVSVASVYFMANAAWAVTNSLPAEAPAFESNVMIDTDSRDDAGDPAPALCNATLLNARALITAAHCVKDAIALSSNRISIQVGTYRYAHKPDGTTVRAGYAPYLTQELPARMLVSDSLAGRIARQGLKTQISPDEDVALVILSAALPLKEDFQFGQILGRAEYRSISSAIRNYNPTVVTINPMAYMSTTDSKRSALLDNISASAAHFESKSSSKVEPGDSGAPLYVQVGGKWKLIGVVKGEARSFWSTYDVYAAIEGTYCSIAAKVTEMDVSCK